MAGYQPSADLMQRLTPRRAEILSDLNHPWGLNTPAHLRGRCVQKDLHTYCIILLNASGCPQKRERRYTELNHLGRHSPRSSTRQPTPGEEVEPTWLVDDENEADTVTAKL
eukprot:COSAG02_NODE_7606_length_2936_cov_5.615791_1_plen_111_part_00